MTLIAISYLIFTISSASFANGTRDVSSTESSPSSENIINEENGSIDKTTNFNFRTYLTKQDFSIEGNGLVTFTNGDIRVTGGRATLVGQYEIKTDVYATVKNLQAIDGYFDASLNNPLRGYISLLAEGKLELKLYGKNEAKIYTLIPKK